MGEQMAGNNTAAVVRRAVRYIVLGYSHLQPPQQPHQPAPPPPPPRLILLSAARCDDGDDDV